MNRPTTIGEPPGEVEFLVSVEELTPKATGVVQRLTPDGTSPSEEVNNWTTAIWMRGADPRHMTPKRSAGLINDPKTNDCDLRVTHRLTRRPHRVDSCAHPCVVIEVTQELLSAGLCGGLASSRYSDVHPELDQADAIGQVDWVARTVHDHRDGRVG